MDIGSLQKEAHAIALSKGWWDQERTFGDYIAEVHAALSRALEAYRKGGLNTWESFPDGKRFNWVPDAHDANREWKQVNLPKHEGVSSEQADVVIRVADMAEYYDVDLAAELATVAPPDAGLTEGNTFREWITFCHFHLSQLSAAEWKIRPARVVPPLRGQVLVIVLIQLGFLLRTVLVMAAYYGIDLDAATAAKMQYLKARSEVGR